MKLIPTSETLNARSKVVDAAKAYIALRDRITRAPWEGGAHSTEEGKALNKAVKDLIALEKKS